MKTLAKVFLAAALAFAGTAHAEVKFQANNGEEYIKLTDETSDQCRLFEFRAELKSTDVKKSGVFGGCWTLFEGIIFVTLDDGTRLAFPPKLFEKVTSV